MSIPYRDYSFKIRKPTNVDCPQCDKNLVDCECDDNDSNFDLDFSPDYKKCEWGKCCRDKSKVEKMSGDWVFIAGVLLDFSEVKSIEVLSSNGDYAKGIMVHWKRGKEKSTTFTFPEEYSYVEFIKDMGRRLFDKKGKQ